MNHLLQQCVALLLLLFLVSGAHAFLLLPPHASSRRWTCAPSPVARGKGHGVARPSQPPTLLWATVAPPPRPEVLDVEDEAEEEEETSPVVAQEEKEEEEEERSWAEELLGSVGLSGDTLLDNLRRSADQDISSRTLRALQAAQVESRSLLAKMQVELSALGAYAASKAVADSKLMVSVGIVVASELAQVLARPLLPSSPSSSSSSSSSTAARMAQAAEAGRNLTLLAALGPSSSSSSALLSLSEKIELVQMGVYPYDWSGLGTKGASARYVLPTFSSAGNQVTHPPTPYTPASSSSNPPTHPPQQDALLQDMYDKTLRAEGRLPFLPPLPKRLSMLALPLKVRLLPPTHPRTHPINPPTYLPPGSLLYSFPP